MNLHEETIKEDLIYKGNFFELINVDVKLPNGKIGNRDIIKHPGACAIIPFLDDNTIILIEQFRKAIDSTLLEIPAGKLEADENIAICAKRELEEETGYVADNIEYLGKIALAPGYCDEYIHLYKATGLTLKEKHCDEDEFTIVKSFAVDQVKKMVRAGEIVDSKTICALAYI